MAMLRETAFQFLKGFGSQRDIFKLVLINHSHVIETIFYDHVRRFDIFGCQRELLNVILTCFRIVGCYRLQPEFERICRHFVRFARFPFSHAFILVHSVFIESGHLFFATAPVIFQRTPSPLTLESGLPL
ncbi:unknown [Parabacteroides johnsonii CAG:246]|nr:unknown [Parabacteroides johnsonii CAG:246]